MTGTIIKVFPPFSASSKSNCSDLKSCTGTDIGDAFWKRELAKIEARKARVEKKKSLFTHPALKLFTQAQLLKLQKNFSKNDAIIQHSDKTIDFKPVVKLFTPDANCTWLLSELSPDLIAFALCVKIKI